MAYGDGSDLIRKRAWDKYIQPQIQSGKKRIELAIKPLMKDLEAEGFKTNRPRQFCTALQKRKFLQEKELVLDRVDGPPSGWSTTVVLHFTYAGCGGAPGPAGGATSERAQRAIDRLYGSMKDEIGAHGGAERFLRWVRSEEDGEDAA
jgi:hypothetical protein